MNANIIFIITLLLCMHGHALAMHENSNRDKLLFFAAEHGRLVSLKAVIVLGVNVNAQENTKDGDTALMIAASEGHKRCVAFLLKQPGIKVDQCNKTGSQALDFAVELGYKQCAALIRQALKKPSI
ncbi:MAG: ankyrin repeat domain-containing protein [Candidatus Dependentiae bacterium]|nr:ankyrin repeat domain-containing protein [Candidatus Dependentiae bacterium]